MVCHIMECLTQGKSNLSDSRIEHPVNYDKNSIKRRKKKRKEKNKAKLEVPGHGIINGVVVS